MSDTSTTSNPGASSSSGEQGGETLTMAQRAADLAQRAGAQASKLVDLARDNPRTAIAAGAALAAGAAAAAAIPLVRSKRKAATKKAAPKSAGTSKTAAKKPATRKAAKPAAAKSSAAAKPSAAKS